MKPAGSGLLLVVYAAFIAIGLPDTVLGAGWPVMHSEFGVSLGALGVLGVVGALSAVASSLVWGRLRHRPPGWAVLVASTLLMALAMAGFGVAGSWGQVVALAVAWGLCGGAIDIELNHFAARHFSRRHMSWLHGCWGIGAAAGPLVMATVLVHTGRWQEGFWALTAVMTLMALGFWSARRLWPAAPVAEAKGTGGPGEAEDTAPPRLARWLSPICFFLVVAAEFATAIWIPSIMVTGHGLPPAEASRWATLFFGAMVIGRFALGAVGDRLDNRQQVRLGISAAIAGAVVFVASGANKAGAAGLLLMGLGAAPLFPALMHETGLRFSAAWSGRMVARQMTGAYLAGALMPLVYSVLVDHVGVGAVIPTAIGLLLLLAAATTALDRATPLRRPSQAAQ